MQQVAFVLTTDQDEEAASGAEQHKGLPCALGRGKGHVSVRGEAALAQEEVKAVDLFGQAAAECSGASSPFSWWCPLVVFLVKTSKGEFACLGTHMYTV